MHLSRGTLDSQGNEKRREEESEMSREDKTTGGREIQKRKERSKKRERWGEGKQRMKEGKRY